MAITVSDILRNVYGAKGLPFPSSPNTTEQARIAGKFTAAIQPVKERSRKGTPLWGENSLGVPVFMPTKLNGIQLPNPLVTITGEKLIVETDVIDVGTVFEKVFIRPYDITIICTLMNTDNTWPEDDVIAFEKLYREGDLYTLECALTDIFLQPKDNFMLTKIALMEMAGIENAQVIELTGRSNIDFELEKI